MKSKYKTYCNNCFHTIWLGERIVLDKNRTLHTDCSKALIDLTPRIINPKYIGNIGKVSKKKLRKALEARTV